jgi:hypothetical protein
VGPVDDYVEYAACEQAKDCEEPSFHFL